MSAVIYARFPDSLKQALHAHAAERGLTLTAALVELLGQGLEALTQQTSVAELEAKLAVATSERAQTHVQLQEAGLRCRPRGSGRRQPPAATGRSPSGRGSSLAPARAAVSPCVATTCSCVATARTRTAAWGSPRSCCRPEQSTPTSTSPSWVRSASSSAWRWPPPPSPPGERSETRPQHKLNASRDRQLVALCRLPASATNRPATRRRQDGSAHCRGTGWSPLAVGGRPGHLVRGRGASIGETIERA